MAIKTEIYATGVIPMFLPRKNSISSEEIILAGDAGGTKTNLSLYRSTADKINFIQGATFVSADYGSAVDIIKEFLATCKQSPERICLGVAGPVIEGKVELTNLSWNLDTKELQEATGIDSVFLINDLEATAYGLSTLYDSDFTILQKGDASIGGNMTIIAPGTGLGEAGLYCDGETYRPFPTEGGHADFSPRTQFDFDLHLHLQSLHGIVSWERLIAGPAIGDIYEYLCTRHKENKPIYHDMKPGEFDPSAVISHAAIEESDEICVETMDHFVRYLARECSNLVLKMKATGGLFLGGGIPPKIAPLLMKSSFIKNYMDCDRMQHLLEQVPIRIILNPKTALYGSAFYGSYH